MFGERRADRIPQPTWQTGPERLLDLRAFQREGNKITVVGCGKATQGTIASLRETQPQSTSILELSSSSKISNPIANTRDSISLRKWNHTINLLSNSEMVILIVNSDDNSREVATALTKSVKELGGVDLVVLELPSSIQKGCEGESCAHAALVRTLIETIRKTDLGAGNFTDFKNSLEQGGFAIAEVDEVSTIQDPTEEATPHFMKDLSFHVDLPRPRSAFIEATSTHGFYPTDAQLDPNAVSQGFHRRMKMTLFLIEDGLTDFSRLSLLTPQLYEMEKTSQTDKRLQLDIGLYQMETS
ncbi:MAG: hypothetical protein V3T10_04635 [Candidatus Bathyarchaeia archaeon]